VKKVALAAAAMLLLLACGERAAVDDQGLHKDIVNNTNGADVAVITGSGPTQVLIDGSQLFSAKAALGALAAVREKAVAERAPAPQPRLHARMRRRCSPGCSWRFEQEVLTVQDNE